MKKIYILLLSLLANISFADMNIVSYQNTSFDLDNSNIDHSADLLSYSFYNSSNKTAWAIGHASGEFEDGGVPTVDTEVTSFSYARYLADRTTEQATYIGASLGLISLDTTSNSAYALQSDSIMYSILGGVQLTPEEGLGYFAEISLDILTYDDDVSNGVALDTETDIGFSLGVSYALSNGVRFTAAIADSGDGTSTPTSIGIGYQF
tara:strand:- start:414 stop:1034 length:621 start_codon:yes stop_codon:yes gene_type:complete